MTKLGTSGCSSLIRPLTWYSIYDKPDLYSEDFSVLRLSI